MQAGERDGNRSPRRLPLRAMAALAGASLLLAASWRVAAEACAEQLFATGEVEHLRRAAQLAPGRALYQLALADRLDRTGGDPLPALREAARLSPTDDSIWIRLGLHEELAGQLADAEKHLLEAARVSRKFLPRWTLANFYYRQGRSEAFWPWAKEALAISYGDRSALFDLCWSLRPEPEFLLERVIPSRLDVRADYASFLVARRQFRVAAAIYEGLAPEAPPGDLNRFLDAIDRMLDSGAPEPAQTVWNALCRSRRIPYPPLDRHSGPVVTNADFSRWTLGRGFDWRVPETPGVVAAPDPRGGWRILLSGDQPERCEILIQRLLLEPGRRYRLGFRARALLAAGGSPPSASGLAWEILGGDGRLWLRAALTDQNLEFTAPAGDGAALLRLVYERVPGSVRARGEIELAAAGLEPGKD